VQDYAPRPHFLAKIAQSPAVQKSVGLLPPPRHLWVHQLVCCLVCVEMPYRHEIRSVLPARSYSKISRKIACKVDGNWGTKETYVVENAFLQCGHVFFSFGSGLSLAVGSHQPNRLTCLFMLICLFFCLETDFTFSALELKFIGLVVEWDQSNLKPIVSNLRAVHSQSPNQGKRRKMQVNGGLPTYRIASDGQLQLRHYSPLTSNGFSGLHFEMNQVSIVKRDVGLTCVRISQSNICTRHQML
jgi:hypothetical protein